MEKKFITDENHIVCNVCDSVYPIGKENHMCSLVRGEPGIPKSNIGLTWEELPNEFCKKCSQLFIVHNDDGSCVEN